MEEIISTYPLYLQLKGFSKHTIPQYVHTVNKFISWLGSTDITQVSYPLVMQYIAYLQDSKLLPSTIQQELQALNHLFTLLQQQEKVVDNPLLAIHMRGVKRKKLHNVIPFEQLDNLYTLFEVQPTDTLQQYVQLRDKVMLGLMVFQGISTTDIHCLDIASVHLRAGEIDIPASRKYAHRRLKLTAVQTFDMIEYVQVGRKHLLYLAEKEAHLLFTSTGSGERLKNTIKLLMDKVRTINPLIQSNTHIRTSVIVHWLSTYSLRKTQYMAGHKYISATEAYKVYLTDKLSDDISKYHPLGGE